MKSTDTNVNNPMSVGEIDLLRTVDSWQHPSVQCMRYEEFELMQIRDPHTIYVFNDKPDLMYYGDMRIKPGNPVARYLIGIEPVTSDKYDYKYEYVIYMNQQLDFGSSILIPIQSYVDPKDAMDALFRINNVGSHESLPARVYSTLVEYVRRNAGIEDFLISCLSSFGFRDDPRLQKIIQLQVSYLNTYPRKDNLDLPIALRDELKNRMEEMNRSGYLDGPYVSMLFKAYSDIYDVVVKYDFFKADKYQKAKGLMNLSDPVGEITKIGTMLGVPLYVV